MAPKFVNEFLIGADPEVVLLKPPHMINASRLQPGDTSTFFGFDHGGYVVEPHPTPHVSTRQVCRNIKKCMDYIDFKFGAYKVRAGGVVRALEREVTLGGHVHIDLPELNAGQVMAMDAFRKGLEHLDILPSAESASRRNTGMYGGDSDVRTEHGHVEYRSMCSWLFDRKTTMLCMTGIKLAAVAPKTVPLTITSVEILSNWLEGFKEEDDDVRWIFDRGYFEKDLTAKPDASVLPAWKADATLGKALLDNHIEATVDTQVQRTATQEARLAARRRGVLQARRVRTAPIIDTDVDHWLE